jgi:hypothetical protein
MVSADRFVIHPTKDLLANFAKSAYTTFQVTLRTI